MKSTDNKQSILFSGQAPREGIDLTSLKVAFGDSFVHKCCEKVDEGDISISENMLYIVAGGSISFTNNSYCISMNKGELILFRKGMRFHFQKQTTCCEEFSSLMIYLPETIIVEYKKKNKIKEDYSFAKAEYVLKPYKICENTLIACKSIESQFKTKYAVDINLQTTSIEYLLLNIAHCNKELYDQIIHLNYGHQREIMNLLNENWSSVPTKGELAKKIGVTEYMLDKRVKEVTGLSTKDYLLEKKIEKAKSLLMQYDTLSVVEVAKMLGYSTSQNFIRAFKAKEGMTPEQWRKEEI